MAQSHLALSATVAALALAAQADAGVFRTIAVDGNVADWAGIAPAFTDATGDASANATSGPVDFTNVYVANDANFLYFRVQLAQPADPTTFFSNYFLDADGNAATGNPALGGVVGAEVLIQSGAAYQEAGGGFNEGQITDGQVLEVGPGVPATDGFEFRISRAATFVAGRFAGTPVFTSNSIALLAESDNGDFSIGDFTGAVNYTFAAAAVPEPATLAALSLGLLPALRRRR